MDEPAPSYEEAIRQKDWLEFVAPYVDVRDYANLCRVSKRFYAVFAIRIWKDPLATLRELRGDISTQPQWCLDLVTHMGRKARRSTASMVAAMDFRLLATGMGSFAPGTSHSDMLGEIPAWFPNLRCILLDGYWGLDPCMLARNRVLSRHPRASVEKLHMLSLADCGLALPARFAVDRWMEGLVYLDLSNTPGSLQSQIDQKSLNVVNLPQLRILKIREKGLDCATASAVLSEFRTRLWSLDVSGNNVNDGFLRDLTELSLPTYSNIKLQTAGHFEAEGKIRSVVDRRGSSNGLFFIDESAWSATFSHPERYLADTPIYHPENTNGAENEGTLKLQTRSNGRGRPRGDSAADVVRLLAGDHGEAIPDALYLRCSSHWPSPQAGITHLRLNGLDVSALAVERLLQCSPGFIEYLECDSPVYLARQNSALIGMAPWLSKSTYLLGFSGGSYLFRPVISSNLRVLKIHHSLVTNIPTVACRSTDVLTKLWLAETCLRERLDLAYPQSFVPDMNPRLYSLTLCMIPRYSTGAVTERLINFLKLAARQEQMIEKVRAVMPLRGPPVLQGLRHIQLEFEPVADDELVSLDDEVDDLDAGALLSQGVEDFSFFSESAWDVSSPSVQSNTEKQPPVTSSATRPPGAEGADGHHTRTPAPEKLDCAPFNQSDGEHITITVRPADGPEQEALTVPVWIGPGVVGPGNPPAVNEYMRNLCDPACVGPGGVMAATTCHVAAGVPPGSLIFRRAWNRMLLPAAGEETIRRPARAELRGMRDVLAGLKEFRRGARARFAEMVEAGEQGHEHEHWRGRLVVALPEGRAQSSDYWR